MRLLLLLVGMVAASACSSQSPPKTSVPAAVPAEQPVEREEPKAPERERTPVADTPDGAVYPIPASIAADCSRPVEGEIMDWLTRVPDGGTAVFATEACYGQDDTITLDDRSRLTVDGNGSTFKALTEGSAARSNWRIRSGDNITIRNMIVRGALLERKFVHELEHQHGYAFQGTQGALLENVQAYNVYGDFVEAQHDSRLRADRLKAPPATDIVVRDSHFDMAGRMGVGLTSVDGFLIENSYIGNVALSAVDVEPDLYGQRARNIRVMNNRFGLMAHSLFVSHGKGGGPEVGHALVAGNVMEVASDTCVAPIFVRGPSKDRRSDYIFRDNELLANGDGIRLDGLENVTVSGNTIRHGTSGRRCPSAVGTALYDAHGVSVRGNLFHAAKQPVRQDARSGDITDDGNRLTP